MKVTLIAAMAKNRIIGADNAMPWHLPEDLAHFKQRTLGKLMIMGSKTLQSIGRPLPGRTTLVLSRKPLKQELETLFPRPKNATWNLLSAQSIPEAFEVAEKALNESQINLDRGEILDQDEIIVAGGGNIYNQTLPLATHLSLTAIDLEVEGDTRFPQWQENEWQLVSEEKHKQSSAPYLNYSFLEYERIE